MPQALNTLVASLPYLFNIFIALVLIILIIKVSCNVCYPAQIAGLIWIQIVLPQPSL